MSHIEVPTTSSSQGPKEYKLDAEQELRFEVEANERIEIELASGLAELFGSELTKGRRYRFLAGAKVAIYTFSGCTIKLYGNQDTCYVSKETPMIFYVNLHGYFEIMRETKGPVIMLCGPVDVGKSTLSHILLNYAVRRGRTPLFVDLDVGQGAIGVPGTVGALLVERPSDPETGFSQTAPITLHYGDNNPENMKLYQLLITELAKLIHERIEADPSIRHSGVIINTCGWITGGGYKALLHASKAFNVDVILAIDQEKLYNELVRDQPPNVQVVFTPKSGGVVVRSRKDRVDFRDNRIREYFYGSQARAVSGGTQYYPHSFDIPFNQLKIFKIGAPAIPISCLPLGMKPDDNLTKVVPVAPSQAISHHILSISFANNPNDILNKNIQGFICVTNVDMERQIITVISPQPRPLPANALLLLSNIQFMDSQ